MSNFLANELLSNESIDTSTSEEGKDAFIRRENEDYTNSKLRVNKDNRNIFPVLFFQGDNKRVRKSPMYVLSSSMPVGEYEFFDYTKEFIVFKNSKTGDLYLNNIQLWLDARCQEKGCEGRGYIRELVKRRGNAPGFSKVAWGAYESKVCHVCSGTGIDIDKIPEYPATSLLAEWLESNKTTKINEIFIREKEGWELMEITGEKKKQNQKKERE